MPGSGVQQDGLHAGQTAVDVSLLALNLEVGPAPSLHDELGVMSLGESTVIPV